MSPSDWIDNREMTGNMTFSCRDFAEAFPSLSKQVMVNNLYRMAKKNRIQSVYRGFYAIVPMQFRDRGVVHPYNYVAQLMRHLGCDYYISLLSAGVLNGAAHQRPMRLSVTTSLLGDDRHLMKNEDLIWNYRNVIPKEMLLQTNSDTDVIQYSNPELTAIDLVQFHQHIGGLSAASTVISELAEQTDFDRFADIIPDITTLPTLQRLGYIYDHIIEDEVQAQAIERILLAHKRNLKYRPLSTTSSEESGDKDKRWKLFINTVIETDDIW